LDVGFGWQIVVRLLDTDCVLERERMALFIDAGDWQQLEGAVS
jgi:hypothetical protein